MLQFKEDYNQRQHGLMFRRIIIFSSSPSGTSDSIRVGSESMHVSPGHAEVLTRSAFPVPFRGQGTHEPTWMDENHQTKRNYVILQRVRGNNIWGSQELVLQLPTTTRTTNRSRKWSRIKVPFHFLSKLVLKHPHTHICIINSFNHIKVNYPTTNNILPKSKITFKWIVMYKRNSFRRVEDKTV